MFRLNLAPLSITLDKSIAALSILSGSRTTPVFVFSMKFLVALDGTIAKINFWALI